MTNKREMAIRQTGMRTYQVEVKLLEEEVVDQETIDKTLNGLADVVMGQLKNQEYIPADAEVTNLQSSQLDDNNVMISIEWDTTLNTSYIICDTLDAVITTAKQITNIGYINVPITLLLIACCLFMISNNLSRVFSNSPESSPALQRPIYI